ncbi:hypothetical protein AGMMS49990_09850 [Endomicrobiia bacterium]|nr:hypothetical protein AGMMS49990_09850 [Endomicrobiia bacterium]
MGVDEGVAGVATGGAGDLGGSFVAADDVEPVRAIAIIIGVVLLNNFGDDVFCIDSGIECGNGSGVVGVAEGGGAGGVGGVGELFGGIDVTLVLVDADGVVDNASGVFDSFGGGNEGIFDGTAVELADEPVECG